VEGRHTKRSKWGTESRTEKNPAFGYKKPVPEKRRGGQEPGEGTWCSEGGDPNSQKGQKRAQGQKVLGTGLEPSGGGKARNAPRPNRKLSIRKKKKNNGSKELEEGTGLSVSIAAGRKPHLAQNAMLVGEAKGKRWDYQR